MHVAYFGPDRSQGTVMKRIRAFLDAGWDVTGFTFKRARVHGQFETFWNNVDLGTIENANYGKRLFSFWRIVRTCLRKREALRSADVIYARNLDIALIALAVRALSGARKAKFCYEVNDIRGVMVSQSRVGFLSRWLERCVLRRVNWLVTSSPRFQIEYFHKVQKFFGPTFILENRIYTKDLLMLQAERDRLVATAESRAATDEPIVIGWFGVLDCQETWGALLHVAVTHPDLVHLYMRGYPEYIEESFFSAVGASPNIQFGGKFNNRTELPAMYAKVDVVCGFDSKEVDANSTWLLPNSLYESGALCRPLLTQPGTATAERVERYGTGYLLELPLKDSLERFVQEFDRSDWLSRVRRSAEIPLAEFAGQEQFEELLGRLQEEPR